MYLSFLLFVFSLIPDHAIYISVVELNHDPITLESSVSVKVFQDDLKDIIRNFNADYNPAQREDFVEKNQLDIAAYFKENLVFKTNDQVGDLEFVSSEIENDAYFLNFKIKSFDPLKKIEVVADFFTELFPDQSNVLTIKNGEKKYFARLTKSKPSYSFTFD